MKTILDILVKAGGWRPDLYLKLENPPYMELVIEAVDESGPCGLRALAYASTVSPPVQCGRLSRQATVSLRRR
jgi:hypothetical protein